MCAFSQLYVTSFHASRSTHLSLVTSLNSWVQTELHSSALATCRHMDSVIGWMIVRCLSWCREVNLEGILLKVVCQHTYTCRCHVLLAHRHTGCPVPVPLTKSLLILFMSKGAVCGMRCIVTHTELRFLSGFTATVYSPHSKHNPLPAQFSCCRLGHALTCIMYVFGLLSASPLHPLL